MSISKKYLIIILVLLCFSCASVRDIENRRKAGKSIIIYYEYDWETVYDAICYISRHSENELVLTLNTMDFAKEEKTIWYDDPLFHKYYKFLGIFFTPINKQKTKVEFVKAYLIENIEVYHKMINQIIKESKYYLENGSTAYKIYTHQNRLKEKALNSF